MAVADFSRFRCLEKQKNVFKLKLDVVSSVYARAEPVQRFLELTSCLEKGEFPAYLESTEGHNDFK